MNSGDVSNMAIQFHQSGKLDMAIELWKQAIVVDPKDPAPNLNLYNVYKSQGNMAVAREYLIRFLNCPVTGLTLDLIPQIKLELVEIEKKLGIIQLPPTIATTTASTEKK